MGRELEALGDPHLSEAAVLNEIGCSDVSIGDITQALEFLGRALNLAASKRDQLNQRVAHFNLGWAYSVQDESRQSVTHYRKALELARELGDFDKECRTLTKLGLAYRELGLYTESIRSFQEVSNDCA